MVNQLQRIQQLPKYQWRAWGRNLYKFSAPVFAIFFAQLALGVDWKKAGLVALFGFYGLLADLFKKANEE